LFLTGLSGRRLIWVCMRVLVAREETHVRIAGPLRAGAERCARASISMRRWFKEARAELLPSLRVQSGSNAPHALSKLEIESRRISIHLAWCSRRSLVCVESRRGPAHYRVARVLELEVSRLASSDRRFRVEAYVECSRSGSNRACARISHRRLSPGRSACGNIHIGSVRSRAARIGLIRQRKGGHRNSPVVPCARHWRGACFGGELKVEPTEAAPRR